MSQEHLRPRTDDPTPEAGQHRWADTPVGACLAGEDVQCVACQDSRDHKWPDTCYCPHCQLDASNGSQFSNHRSQGRSRLRSQEVVDSPVTLSDPHAFYLMENFRLKS